MYADKPSDWREAHYETDAAQFAGVGLGAGGVGFVGELHDLERVIGSRSFGKVDDTVFAASYLPLPVILREQRTWRIARCIQDFPIGLSHE